MELESDETEVAADDNSVVAAATAAEVERIGEGEGEEARAPGQERGQIMPTPKKKKPAAKSSSSTQHVPEQEEEVIALSSIIPNDQIRPTDILLGRGSQHAQWEGNVRFRAIAKERRREYNGRRSNNKTKNVIAREILEAVLAGRDSSHLLRTAADAATNTAPPGRFLQQVDILVVKQAGLPTDQIHWRVAPNGRALEKIKMTLRQKKKKRGRKGKRKRSNSSASSSSSLSSSSSSSSSLSSGDNGGGRDKRLKSAHGVSGGGALDVRPAAINGIPRQVTLFAGGGFGGGVGLGNQQLLSALAPSLLPGGGGAPGITRYAHAPLQPQQQPQPLPASNTPIDQNVLVRYLLGQAQQQQQAAQVQQQQQQQQLVQAAALSQLLQPGGNTAPTAASGAIPANNISGPILSLLLGGQQQQGPQQLTYQQPQHQQGMQANAVMATLQPRPSSTPQITAATIANAAASSATPSLQVLQAILNQQRQATSVLAASQPPPAVQQQSANAPETSPNDAGGNQRGEQETANVDVIQLLLSQALAAKSSKHN